MADNKPMVLGGTAIKPKERHGWEAVRYLLHNPETGEILTRTPKSWLLITGFYIIYYSCLAGFWAAMLNIFFLTLNDNSPKWVGEDSLIGISPGLGLKPGQLPDLIDSSMISYAVASENDTGVPGADGYVAGRNSWIKRTEEFLKTYSDPKEACVSGGETKPGSCFDLIHLGPCGEKPYGYDQGKPCVYLKLNKIYGVKNEIFPDKIEDVIVEGKKIPDELVDVINLQTDKDQVWVECHGEYPADIEALGTINYFPASQGFLGKYFPYENQKGYQSPIVAVQFANARQNQLLHVECRAWAKNIGYNKRDRIGINHLELLILSDEAAKKVTGS